MLYNKLPFDISPLNPDNVVSYRLAEESGRKVAYVIYKDPQCQVVPDTWNLRVVLYEPKEVLSGSFSSATSSHLPEKPSAAPQKESPDSADREHDMPKNVKFRYYVKQNAKDKLITVNGRACLVLGTAEAVTPESDSIHGVYLLFTYDFYQKSASVKFDIPTYFYYDTSTGKCFVDSYLTKLNEALFKKTTKHFFNISPRWNVFEICEIYMKGKV